MRLGIKIKQACFTAPGFHYLCIGITSSDMTTILIAILLLALLPDIYIWHLLSRAGVAAGWGVAALLPTVLLLAMAAAAAAGYMNPATMKTFFGVLLCVTLPKLLFTLVSVAGRCAARPAATAMRTGRAAYTCFLAKRRCTLAYPGLKQRRARWRARTRIFCCATARVNARCVHWDAGFFRSRRFCGAAAGAYAWIGAPGPCAR